MGERRCERALLLQGPNGPFFPRLAAELREAGVEVVKVNFHGGEAFYFRGPGAVEFHGALEQWPDFLRALLRERKIDTVFIFGDGRPIHRAAIPVIESEGVELWVFEEGYLRPDWITLEKGGVNGRSSLPRDPAFYLEAVAHLGPRPEVISLGPTFGIGAWHSTVNALAYTHLGRRFRRYEHHRPLNAWWHTYCWVRGYFRKKYFQWKERGVQERLARDFDGRYFFVPLQVHNDNQLTYSGFDSMERFAEEVATTFARVAPPDQLLVFKHHPMDRPFREYGEFFAQLRAKTGLGERLVYVHDLHMPSLLEHARGTVTINSTVGLQSLQHRTPTKTLGYAVYDMPGLTFQGSLEEFFAHPGGLDPRVLRAFRLYLLHKNQANGNVFKRVPGVDTPTGVVWFDDPPPPWLRSGD